MGTVGAQSTWPAADATPPEGSALGAWRQRHAGASLLVCGCGPSLLALPAQPGLVSIGVNDVGRHFDPTYLVVVNPPQQFRGGRFQHVRASRATALFTQLALGPVNPPVVRFGLGQRGGTDDAGDEALHYTQNSPYVAVGLAALMGAQRIGLIGVDFTEHHFFGATGRHPLAGRLAQIDAEYGALARALAARGVELVNLSPSSRLTSVPRADLASWLGAASAWPVPPSVPRPTGSPAGAVAKTSGAPAPMPAAATPPLPVTAAAPRRVFIVSYRFQTVGNVFDEGLRHAAQALGLAHAEAACDDPLLPQRVARFRPDLVLVVHGRRFVQRWSRELAAWRGAPWRTAVWLVDEPYEVDDTAAWSHHFDAVFVNDAATLARHAAPGTAAHFLPMAYDPVVHCDPAAPRPRAAGFIGGASPTRERCLLPLAEAGLLGYVVGGPWRDTRLRRLMLAPVVPPAQTAQLYQQTEIVLNVFRDRHHYNAAALQATAMNPRIYEALACGALVVSEAREEMARIFPALPQFRQPDELPALVGELLANRPRLAALRTDCRSRLAGHAYADRLMQALRLALGDAPMPEPVPPPPPGSHVFTFTPPPRPVERQSLKPFAQTPRRHLLYHLWPVRGSTWRWNVEQLLRRIDLFNGRRLIGVVTDERSEDEATVRTAFAGHGCEFTVLPNDARGEAATFPHLLQGLAGTDEDDVSFYAHAKGVKYEPQLPPAVRRWAEAQYTVMLDHWPAVRAQLDGHAMSGMLRRHGRFANHQHVGDWHYSGTFFWFRHGPVFSRRWSEVPPFYGGVEAWPGMLFSRREAGCLLLDGLRELPYHERFWKQRGDPAVAQWRRQQRSVAVPHDLARPAPFDGLATPRLEHKPDEFGWWLDEMAAAGMRRLLVIGAADGAVQWHVARRWAQRGLPLHITTLHAGPAPLLHRLADEARQAFGATLHHLDADSATPGVLQALGTPHDAAYIDGEHGYAACRRDVALALAAGARTVALHDIVDSDWHAQNRCAVSRVWAELQATRVTRQRAGAHWGGIGILRSV
ncbi:MAG: hypothetical protein C0505_04050 [Leptothrix sp. (in: Bacteria)]|nr:hypothetical protein [Leptothrix sp. (in: b-proteobacteria)]